MERQSERAARSNGGLREARRPQAQGSQPATSGEANGGSTEAIQVAQGGLLTTLLDILECPVCREVIQPPFLQCRNGHLICAQCRRKSTTCPVCRARKDRIRNVGLEKLVDSARFPCSYAPRGCTESFPLSGKAQHEEYCYFGPFRCVLGPEACKWAGPREELVDHVVRAHPFIPRFRGNPTAFTAARFDRPEGFSWFAVVTCLGRDFIAALKKSGTAGHSKMSTAVAVVGSSEEQRSYHYRLEFCGDRNRLTWEAEMKGINSLSRCIESGDCLVFDLSTAQQLLNGADLVMELSIYGA
ncbi:hypothetical protein HPB52_017450 [Rhipicephalus sanguineus]|uniref:E3 ubiquitin-protein ligase n=1 Tax=Rhipicephalus sanguineus TaxID=34632 RepID=A0A9D4PF08_RHISA|nr:hypothetical protein HPB52_017450 [Rhipicephalus sanguineus]